MKKFILAAIIAVSGIFTAANAQTLKFGNVDSQAIIAEMPETKQAEKELEKLQTEYENQLAQMGEAFQQKYADFQQKADSLPQAIAEERYQELQQMQQRIENFQQTAARDVQQKQQQLLAPIFDKLAKAIETVGEREGFTYIFQLAANSISYFDPKTVVDVNPLVKKELGIK